jgi:enamine deaminase RidA (YjgF/YER057c/UK114 family)
VSDERRGVAIGAPQYLSPGKAHPAYSTIVKCGNLVFTTAMLAEDEHGNLVGRGDAEAQVRQVWRNLELLLNSVGGTIRNIVSTSTHITHVDHMRAVMSVRCELFPTNPPATSRPLVVERVTRSEDFFVSISAIAIVD